MFVCASKLLLCVALALRSLVYQCTFYYPASSSWQRAYILHGERVDGGFELRLPRSSDQSVDSSFVACSRAVVAAKARRHLSQTPHSPGSARPAKHSTSSVFNNIYGGRRFAIRRSQSVAFAWWRWKLWSSYHCLLNGQEVTEVRFTLRWLRHVRTSAAGWNATSANRKQLKFICTTDV